MPSINLIKSARPFRFPALSWPPNGLKYRGEEHRPLTIHHFMIDFSETKIVTVVLLVPSLGETYVSTTQFQSSSLPWQLMQCTS